MESSNSSDSTSTGSAMVGSKKERKIPRQLPLVRAPFAPWSYDYDDFLFVQSESRIEQFPVVQDCSGVFMAGVVCVCVTLHFFWLRHLWACHWKVDVCASVEVLGSSTYISRMCCCCGLDGFATDDDGELKRANQQPPHTMIIAYSFAHRSEASSIG
jgi:hypothetical protein